MRSCYLVLAVLVPLVICASARAGTYDVYSCRLPDGSPAPAAGWVPLTSGNAEQGSVGIAANECGGGGELTASLPPFALVGTDAGWRFTPPPGTDIAGFEIFRAVRPASRPGGPVGGYVASLGSWPPAELPNDADEQCLGGYGTAWSLCDKGLGAAGLALDQVNRYERRGLHANRLTLGLGCWMFIEVPNPACSEPTLDFPDLIVFAARMTLRDDSPPMFESADLASQFGAAAVRGIARFAVTAADQGAGLSETSLVVDGIEGPRRSVDDAAATCRRPYVDPVPCPSRGVLSVPFDSRAVADGVHVVQIAVYDAAGNRSLSAPASALVANAVDASSLVTGPNGRGATRFARLRSWLAGRSRRTERALAYGATTSVNGQLTTSGGAPIRGATLQVEQRDIGISGRPTRPATLTTDAAGRFTYRVARGASRLLRFTYTAFPGDAGPVASSQVTVHVRAGVSLKASPGRVRNGTVLTFRGRVLGERGQRAVVTIYALTRGPRPRIPVETLRAAASGRFTYRYRFQSIPGPVVYRFEARVLKQTGFPYVEGASRPVAVHGRP